MLKVGITGGIGSGKSTVARIFSVLGIPVYYADMASRKLMNEDPDVIAAITGHFGPESYRDKMLNRAHISSLVFRDPDKLALLNRLTHPATIRHANEWMLRHEREGIVPYVLKEAALIFESGSAAHLDFVIGVSAPLPLRIHRIMQRDSISREEVLMRIDRQMDESVKMKLCDAVVVNDEVSMIIPQVLELHEKLLLKMKNKDEK